MYIFEWGLCGIGRSKHNLFGVGEDFTYYKFMFFKITRWKKGGWVISKLREIFDDKDNNFLEYLPQMKKAREAIREDLKKSEFASRIDYLERDLKREKERGASLNRRCSDLTNENEAFRNVLKVLNNEEVKWMCSHGFSSDYKNKD